MFNNGNKLNLGLDLISTDLFIGRDLGLQPFYAYYEHCTGKMVRSWDDLLDTIPADALTDLKGVYQSVFDVDAYAGVALEAKCGSYLGTVGKCLVVEQYQRTTTGNGGGRVYDWFKCLSFQEIDSFIRYQMELIPSVKVSIKTLNRFDQIIFFRLF